MRALKSLPSTLCKLKNFLIGGVIFLTLISSFLFSSCRKIEVDENARLHFSTSTITFDTIFSTVGSIPKRLTVYNRNNFPVSVNVRLAEGSNSFYSLNVDGEAGREVKNVEIAARDSMFVHVKVTLNPGNQNTPFLVLDSILFQVGRNIQDVDLVAYGQDAHFIVADKQVGNIHYKVVAAEHETTVWTKDKPYVIYGWAAVDSLGKLIIEPGTKIYIHRGGGIWVYRYGNIQVNGTKDEPVLFRGDRLESWFDTDYSQWDRIWINEGSEDNVIKHAIITNAFIGIQVEALKESLYNNNIIRHTIIKNTAGTGLLARASKLTVDNCLITNNGVCGLQLEIGQYQFEHVTIANYFSQTVRKNPAVYLANSYTTPLATYVGDASFSFTNCIIYGNIENELMIKKYNDNAIQLHKIFENCLLRTTLRDENFIACLYNENPQFCDYRELDFTLKENSPAIDVGKVGLQNSYDLAGNWRDALPDLGAFEFIR